MEAEDTITERKSGKFVRFLRWFRRRSWKTQILLIAAIITAVMWIFAERNLYAVIFLAIRKYAVWFVLLGLVVWLIIRSFKRSKVRGKIILIVLTLSIISMWIFTQLTPWQMYTYVSSYVRYKTLSTITLTRLPETAHEPIQPRVSIQTLAEQRLQENEIVSRPFQMRDKDSSNKDTYRWTMAKEPSSPNYYQRIRKSIETIFSVPTEIPSPNFSGKNQADVQFPVGQTLLLGSQVHTATMRRLSFLDLFSVEPGEPRFMRDDSGKWVQVIPLIRWRGLFFPQPEFGGVNIIHQGPGRGVPGMFERFLFGAGEVLSPTEMRRYPYLQGQNLMPNEVSESIAKSFRFQKGFWAPLPMNHDGDTRIPEISDGIGEQPITTFFKMSQVSKDAADKLYEYFGLEPYDTTKHGLITSLAIPSDGDMTVYVYNHSKDGLVGASAVPGRIRDNMKTYDWGSNRVAGIRPYNRVIDGEFHSFWKASVVAITQNGKGSVSGGLPTTALVDSKYERVILVPPDKPETWTDTLKSALGTVWKQ